MSEQNYKEVWLEALSQIQAEYKAMGKENQFVLGFSRLIYEEDTIDKITVSVPSEFYWKQALEKQNIKRIQEKIAELIGQEVIIDHINKAQSTNISAPAPVESEPLIEDTKKINEPVYIQQTESEPLKTPVQTTKTHPFLSPNYTFDKFVPGENSDYAFQASQAAARNPGKAYNPILIYGGVGLGKTHLMEAIGNYIYSQDQTKKISYISAEAFTNEFISSISTKTTEKFKTKFRSLDVLLIDDIHFLVDKNSTQEELFYTFNALYDRNCQMVFTCDRPITELKGIEDRLRTRFSRGLNIDLQPPSYETRRAIIEKKLKDLGKSIASDVIDFVAKNVQTNVRDLESCLTKLTSYADLVGKEITIQTAQELLRDIFSQPVSGTISIDTIQKVVADYYRISISDMKSKKRESKVVLPRQVAIYITRQLTEYSFPEIGNEFGGKDHTTIMHAHSKIEEMIRTDSTFDSQVKLLMRQIKDYKK